MLTAVRIGSIIDVKRDPYLFTLYGVLVILSLFLSIYFVFQTSHAVIRPLRNLNSRMNEVIEQENTNEIDFRG